uniref:Uncharacterized protein n=1 Tax=Chromera velia CCMP2878 TaxID=1169474 RepID=A0A0G4HY00_9ALVE|eukprot:Cvel_9387.t1-p1 / transcript=Cvel_9387.t1 / gene=Cvel_9387 / organism=Chromera_velia_CCMP2878 / gene_product=hypothetical protein / transcript_product=hypothetical protein / location=Cvel_scaffold539:40630-44155(-) / protein_length=512 / sequence_SO=supercontig / SO=protein_coding / is_pseudo=false
MNKMRNNKTPAPNKAASMQDLRLLRSGDDVFRSCTCEAGRELSKFHSKVKETLEETARRLEVMGEEEKFLVETLKSFEGLSQETEAKRLALEALRTELTHAETETAELRRSASAREKILAESERGVREAEERAESLEEENKETRQRIGKVREEVALLRTAVSSNKAVAESRTAEAKVAHQTAAGSLKAAEAQRERLAKELEEAEKAVEKSEAALSSLPERVERLRTEVDRLTKEDHQIRQELRDAETATNSAKETEREAAAELEHAKMQEREIEVCRREVAELRAAASAEEEALRAAEGRHAEAEAELGTRRRALLSELEFLFGSVWQHTKVGGPGGSSVAATGVTTPLAVPPDSSQKRQKDSISPTYSDWEDVGGDGQRVSSTPDKDKDTTTSTETPLRVSERADVRALCYRLEAAEREVNARRRGLQSMGESAGGGEEGESAVEAKRLTSASRQKRTRLKELQEVLRGLQREHREREKEKEKEKSDSKRPAVGSKLSFSSSTSAKVVHPP